MNKVTILRGIPGAGKTTYVEKVLWPAVRKNEIMKTFSTDRYWGPDYKIDLKRLGEAHADCFLQFDNALQQYRKNRLQGELLELQHLFVIDNMSIFQRDIAPYILAAQAHGFDYEIVTIWADWAIAAKRNVHRVTEHIVFAKYQELLSEKLPPFWKQRIVFDFFVGYTPTMV